MNVRRTFVCAGTSRSPACLCSHPTAQLLVYANNNTLVCVHNPHNRWAVCLGQGHQHRVVACAHVLGSPAAFVSADVNGNVMLWTVTHAGAEWTMTLTATLDNSHNCAVSAVCAVAAAAGSTTVLSADSEGRVRVALASVAAAGGQQQQLDSLTWPRLRALCVDMRPVEHMSHLCLCALGCDDAKIRICIADTIQKRLTLVHTLVGHTDWVRDVRFHTQQADGSLLLASCSQDTHIRVWRIGQCDAPVDYVRVADLPQDEDIRLKSDQFGYEALDASLADIGDGPLRVSYQVTLEAILSGHTEWVFSVCWSASSPNTLVSTSMDKSLIIWTYDREAGLWLDQVRLGEQGGQSAGYYGAVVGASGDWVATQSYTGGLILWTRDPADDSVWQERAFAAGHTASVTDCSWHHSGAYLLSTSHDQTTRAWAPAALAQDEDATEIFEIGRPQVHGHNLQCLAALRSGDFVSGAEEKLLRVFSAPRSFAAAVNALCPKHIKQTLNLDAGALPAGASLPSLGLSNKQVDQSSSDPSHYFEQKLFTAAPCEHDLQQNTLWPERIKLYGHGFELYSLAASHNGQLIASACKASQPADAAIIVWSTQSWAPVGPALLSHQLTVTALAFSPDDRYLLSVSRDRQWTIHRCGDDGLWKTACSSATQPRPQQHSRIIWSAAWAPCSQLFFTVARDKKLCGWRLSDDTTTAVRCLSHVFEASANAVDCAPVTFSDCLLLAVGLENGQIALAKLRPAADGSIEVVGQQRISTHSSVVQRVRFRPVAGRWQAAKADQQHCVELASCSEGALLAVHAVHVQH